MSNHNYKDRRRRREFEHQHRYAPGGRRIPDRWLKYNAIGEHVVGTRFLPFKTPLHSHICKNSNLAEKSFDVDIVLQNVREAGKTLGLVIDLTNTDKYYNSLDWSKHGIQYEKIRCPGHEVHDREDVVKIFNNIVDDFIRSHTDDTLIGVHCTHGLNRTGYLICRYLIQREKWSSDKAIDGFEKARGYPIERPQYKVKLREVEEDLARDKAARPDESADDEADVKSRSSPRVSRWNSVNKFEDADRESQDV